MKLTQLIKYVEQNSNSAILFTPPIYENCKTYFIRKFTEEITIKNEDDYSRKFEQINSRIEEGMSALGLINYEFGYLTEEKFNEDKFYSSKKLLRFSFTDKNNLELCDSKQLDYDGIQNLIGLDLTSDFKLNTTKDEYIRSVEQIRNYIKEGDTYQVNYTIKSKFNLETSVSNLFAQLIFAQSARYIALINLNDEYILSASPELFFEIKGDEIIAKPMKGTIGRGTNILEDAEREKELLNSTKDQAENIMIVDLLRNDLGRICKYDSIRVNNKYEIEKYESIFQLTSNISGKLQEKNLSSIIENLFPSGSITGAPKIRTMEIIKEMEKEERGIYTGSIGLFSKDYSIANVAIRTIAIDKNSNSAEMGIGSGIVWDSEPEKEYDEVLLKSNFLRYPTKYFELFETMLVENGEIFLLDHHLNRLRLASEYFLFLFDIENIRSSLANEISKLNIENRYKLKLQLDKWGDVNITIEELQTLPSRIRARISKNKIDSLNKFQYFKTTHREMYDRELTEAKNNDYDEVIYFNENDYLAEGAFTNVILKINNQLFTPPLETGILNGCYREYGLAKNSELSEKKLNRQELIKAEKLILINSVRKEIEVSELYDENNRLIKTYE